MISKMEKYVFLVFHQEYKDFLYKLRSLGVVHISEKRNPKEVAELQEMLETRKEVATTIRALQSYRMDDAPAVTMIKDADGKAVMTEAAQLLQRRNELEQEFATKQREVSDMSLWGDFDIEQLNALRDAGYVIDFYTTTKSNFKEEWEDTCNAMIINQARSNVYFITVNKAGEGVAKPEADLVKMPNKRLSEFENELTAIEAEQTANMKALQDFANHRIGELEGYAADLENKFDFSNAAIQADAEAGETLMVLEGWVPAKDAEAMKSGLTDSSCYYKQMEIEAEDNVPVKLSNNRYARLFESITKMYSLPNYGEIDVTALFAPFFMLFFALCFGDGGYGLLLFIGATIAKMKSKSESVKTICSMMQWLGGTTAVVGSLMGTVLGMVMPWAGDDLLGSVRDDYFLNQNNMMMLSVVLGLIQIVFGKFVAGYKTQVQKGFKYGLATYGWGTFILFGGLGYAFHTLAATQGAVLGKVALGFFAIAALGFLVALFYNSPGKNIFMNFGAGLWATYNTASGLLGDTLSYIRLFAIGLTGGILGGVFNNLAVQIGGGLPIGLNFIVMAVILLFGHGLNIGLCMISSLVHPLRLTFVEFYKNSEFEGGGKEYSPFRVK